MESEMQLRNNNLDTIVYIYTLININRIDNFAIYLEKRLRKKMVTDKR